MSSRSVGLIAAALPVAVAVFYALPVRAQQPTTPLAFEAASVKPNNSSDFHMAWHFLPGGKFSATNAPLFVIVGLAYDVGFQSVRLSGGPNWIRSEKYDIEATAGPSAIPAGSTVKQRDDRTRVMLQNLLADRFQLVMRRETREMPAYVIVVAKNGPKLHKSSLEEKDCPEIPARGGRLACHIINGGMGRGLHAKAVTLTDIVTFVENWSDRPIVDQTGLQGLFEVETDGWAPMLPRARPPGQEPSAEEIAMADPTRPTLFMIFDRLGLKMEPQRAPVETFVIDHVEKPTEN
ncbi:MAG TPA: TIGR03435 family protein [Bryobacteraceae bacterium]|nr:TIGR03435 family protein [Bryobacteraceae bacterium]